MADRRYKIILGIGNPGAKYKNTRHNVGYKVVECLAKYYNVAFETSRFFSLIAHARFPERDILLLKPLTYVNRSVVCAKAVLDWYKLTPANLLVIVDDVSLPLGKIRFREKGSSGGHNGLKSLITGLETEEFCRLRVGIGRDEERDLASFVLSPFHQEEGKIIEQAIIEARDSVIAWL